MAKATNANLSKAISTSVAAGGSCPAQVWLYWSQTKIIQNQHFKYCNLFHQFFNTFDTTGRTAQCGPVRTICSWETSLQTKCGLGANGLPKPSCGELWMITGSGRDRFTLCSRCRWSCIFHVFHWKAIQSKGCSFIQCRPMIAKCTEFNCHRSAASNNVHWNILSYHCAFRIAASEH